MRAARLKQIKKNVHALTQLGYRPPFNILADHNFLISFNASKMTFKQIETILGAPIKIYTTHCEYKRYKETVKDKKLIGAVDVKKCTHEEKELRTLECIDSHVPDNNPNHYFIAISPKYRHLKSSKSLPIIFLRSGVLCVEVGKVQQEKIEESRKPKLLSPHEKEVLDKMFS